MKKDGDMVEKKREEREKKKGSWSRSARDMTREGSGSSGRQSWGIRKKACESAASGGESDDALDVQLAVVSL